MAVEKAKNSESLQEDTHVSSLIAFEKFGTSPSADLGDAVYSSGIESGDKANSLGENLYNQLLAQNISLQGAQYSGKDGYIFIKLPSGDILVFSKNETSGQIEQLQKTPEEVVGEIAEKEKNAVLKLSHTQRILEGIMNAIEVIFQKNSQEWFGYIDENDSLTIDTLKFPWSDIPEVSGKKKLHITELQKLARMYFGKVTEQRRSVDPKTINSKEQTKFSQLQEKYIDYIVGIGNIYEGGSRAFAFNADGSENVSQKEIEESIEALITSKSIDECLSYMIRKQAQIEANNWQSTENERTYTLWNHTLNKVVLDKLKQEDASDKIFLQYAKIVSGRDVPEFKTLVKEIKHGTGSRKIYSHHSLDKNMLDPDSASEALLYVFGREGGIFSKIEGRVNIKDPKIPEESDCSHIVQNTISNIANKVEGYDGDISNARGILLSAGFSEVLNLEEGTKYTDLSLEKKMMLSMLVRLSEKLTERGGQTKEDFGKLFLEIADEGQDAVIDSINDNFDGEFLGFNSKDSKDMGLEGIDAEIFDLYNDIWGNGGLFDFSDKTIEGFKTAAIFGATLIAAITLTIAAGVVAPILVSSLTASVITASVIGTGVTRLVTQESFDTPEEFAVDLITDLGTAVIFGYLGGKLTETTFMKLNILKSGKLLTNRFTTKQGWIHNGALFVDTGILGVGTEFARNFILRNPELAQKFDTNGIEGNNRFIYEEFHKYVTLNLDSYLGKS